MTPHPKATSKVEREELVTLAACPIGLFWCDDTLALKTEYGNNEGRIDAYIVSSGEFFWGDAPQTITSQRAQLVAPIDTDTALSALCVAPAPVVRGDDVERGEQLMRAFWREAEKISGEDKPFDTVPADEREKMVIAMTRALSTNHADKDEEVTEAMIEAGIAKAESYGWDNVGCDDVWGIYKAMRS